MNVYRAGPNLFGALNRFSFGAPKTNISTPDALSFLIYFVYVPYILSLASLVLLLALAIDFNLTGVTDAKKGDFEMQSGIDVCHIILFT